MLADIHANTLSQVALLVAVITPQYVKSAWCLNELSAFMESAPTRGGRSRVFKVVKSPVPTEEEPEGLRDFIGYQFFEYDGESGRPREFSPEVRPARDIRYWEKLDDLAYDIKQMLEELKYRNRPDGPSEAA
jgi:hypothetical protein